MKEKKSKIEGLRIERKKIEAQLESLLYAQKKAKEIEEELKEKKIISFDETTNFLRKIVISGKKGGIDIQRINTHFSALKDIEKGNFVYPVFEMAIKSKFLDLGRFFESLEQESSIKGILKANISLDENDYPYLKAKIVIEIMAEKGKK